MGRLIRIGDGNTGQSFPVGSPIKTPGDYNFDLADITEPQFWIEQIGNYSPARDEVSPKFAHSTLYAFVSADPEQYYAFENAVCGWHMVNDLGVLVRNGPLRHPRKPNLYATRISDCRGMGFDSKIDLSDTGDQQELSLLAEQLAAFALYKLNLVAVEFAPPKYVPLDVSKCGTVTINNPSYGPMTFPQEWRRYVEIDQEANIYDVSINSLFNFQWAEGAPKTAGASSFQGEINFFEVKTTFSLHWRFVPEDYVFNTIQYDWPFAPKLAAAAGRVNATPFAGFPAGTLLMLEPKVDRYQSGTLRRADGNPFFYCDITLPIIHFDPVLSDGLTMADGSAYEGGHNAKPWLGANANGNAGTILIGRPAGQAPPPALRNFTKPVYALVTSSGTTTGIRIYGTYEYANIFTHWAF